MPRSRKLEPGALALRLSARMHELGITIDQLAQKASENVDVGYEQIRKIIRGLSFPSKPLLKEISSILGLKYPEVQELLVTDKIKKKHGVLASIVARKNPELEPLELLWPYLTSVQKDVLMNLADSYAKANREQPSPIEPARKTGYKS